MESPTGGTKEEMAHTTGAGLSATGTLPAGGEAVPRIRGALAGGGAEESYPANTTRGGTREKVTGRFLRLHHRRQPRTARREARGKELSGPWAGGVLSGDQNYGGCSRSD